MQGSTIEGALSSLQAAILFVNNIPQATMCSIFGGYEIYELCQCTFLSDRHIGNAVQVQQYLFLLSEWLTIPYCINLWC